MNRKKSTIKLNSERNIKKFFILMFKPPAGVRMRKLSIPWRYISLLEIYSWYISILEIYSAIYLQNGDISLHFRDISPPFGDITPICISKIEIYLLRFEIYLGDISLIYLHYITFFHILKQRYIFQLHFSRFSINFWSKFQQRYISNTHENVRDISFFVNDIIPTTKDITPTRKDISRIVKTSIHLFRFTEIVFT